MPLPVDQYTSLPSLDQMGAAKFVEIAAKYAALGKIYEVPQLLRDMAASGKKFLG